MARLRALLYYARLSERRAQTIRRSGSEKAVAWLLGIAVLYLLFRQLEAITVGPLPMRSHTAKTLLMALATVWILLPCSVPTAISNHRLRLYPLTKTQRVVFQILAILQNWRVAVLVAVSAVSVFALVRLPHAWMAIVQATTGLAVIASMGVGGVIAVRSLRIGSRRGAGNGQAGRRYGSSLLRKELRCYLRMLDFYFVFVLSIVVALTEFFGAWISPVKAVIPLLFLAELQISAVMNPFGLETPSQLDRYRLLPAPYWKLLFKKHLALFILYLAGMAPLAAAMISKMSFMESCLTAALFSLILMSWLVMGILLMRLPSARQIRMAFGTISGGNMSALLMIQAAILVAVLPSMAALAMYSLKPMEVFLILLGLLFVLIAVYVLLLRKQDWPVDLPEVVR